MKEGLHPNYAPTQVKCACGAVIETASTKSDMRVDICSNCHPFFTGKQGTATKTGRVEKFNRKYGINTEK